MSKKAASLLTLNSLSALSKVRPCSHPIKTLAFSNYVTTAAQTSNFDTSVADNVESYDHHSQNPSFSPNSSGSVQKPNGNGSNPAWGRREGDQFARDGNFSGSYGQNYGDYQNYSGGYWEYSRKVNQNYPAERNRNIRGDYVTFNGNFQQNHSKFSDNISTVYDGNRNLQSAGERPQGQTGHHLPGHSQSQGSWNSNYTQNGNQFQPAPNLNYTEKNELYQQGSGNSQYQQNSHGGQNVNSVQYQGNSNGFQDIVEVPQISSSPYNGTLDELDGFCKVKKVKEAVEVLRLLEERNVPVDLPRLLQLMEACGEAEALEEAKAVHNHMVSSLSPMSVSTSNKILEVYAKCGAIDVAFDVFNKMSERDLDSWDTMITYLSKNEFGEDVIDLFTQFKQAGLKPNAHIYNEVFSACSVVGDVYEGMLHFESMTKDYGIVPSMEHYTSIVNMLGSTGYLDEAIEFIEKMPIEPSIEIWETLMILSRIHGNKELGDRCAELVETLNPNQLHEKSKAGLVLLKDSELAKVKEKKNMASQNPLEIRSRTHEYRAGDTSHPENDRIYALLRGLRTQMKDEGYIAETRFVLHDIDQEGKEDALLSHSERLAAAYGFLTSPARAPIRVIKNLRVCGDCHNALKIISKIVGRELIMRDAKRFHHFKDGVCSCRDYW